MKTLQEIVDWLTRLEPTQKVVVTAILLLVLAFVLLSMWQPRPAEVTAEAREIAHRIGWIQRRLTTKPLLVDQAWEAYRALQGGGGGFRPLDTVHKDTPLVGLLVKEKASTALIDAVSDLQQLMDELPSGHSPGQVVESELAEKLELQAEKLSMNVSKWP